MASQFSFLEIISALLSLAFGLWAGVVMHIGNGIRGDLKEIGNDLKQESQKLNQYIVQTERRLSVIEDRLELYRNNTD